MKKFVRNLLVVGLVVGGSLAAAAPASAAAFPSCTKNLSGDVGTVHCSPRADGDSFLFQASVECEYFEMGSWSNQTKFVRSAWVGPGSTATASCAGVGTPVWVGYIVQG